MKLAQGLHSHLLSASWPPRTWIWSTRAFWRCSTIIKVESCHPAKPTFKSFPFAVRSRHVEINWVITVVQTQADRDSSSNLTNTCILAPDTVAFVSVDISPYMESSDHYTLQLPQFGVLLSDNTYLVCTYTRCFHREDQPQTLGTNAISAIAKRRYLPYHTKNAAVSTPSLRISTVNIFHATQTSMKQWQVLFSYSKEIQLLACL